MANERVQTNGAGHVVLKLKTPWGDGTRQLVMSPLEFSPPKVSCMASIHATFKTTLGGAYTNSG